MILLLSLMGKGMALDLNRYERCFCPDNRTPALHHHVGWEIHADVEDRIFVDHLIRSKQDSRAADVHGLSGDPFGHTGCAKPERNRDRVALGAIQVSMSI